MNCNTFHKKFNDLKKNTNKEKVLTNLNHDLKFHLYFNYNEISIYKPDGILYVVNYAQNSDFFGKLPMIK